MSQHIEHPPLKINVLNSQHNNVFVESVTSFFVKQQYLDLVFICRDNICVQTHKLVMSSVSEFISDIIECNPCSLTEIIYISLPEVDSRIMEIFTNFLYEGITKVNIEEIACFKELMSMLKINLSNLDITPGPVKVVQKRDMFYQNKTPVCGKLSVSKNNDLSGAVEQHTNMHNIEPAACTSFPLGSANTEVFPLQEQFPSSSSSSHPTPGNKENSEIPTISNVVIGGLVIKQEAPDYDESVYGCIANKQAEYNVDVQDSSQSNLLNEPGQELLQQAANIPTFEEQMSNIPHSEDPLLISHGSCMNSSDFHDESQSLEQPRSNILENSYVNGMAYSGLMIRAVEDPVSESEDQITTKIPATTEGGFEKIVLPLLNCNVERPRNSPAVLNKEMKDVLEQEYSKNSHPSKYELEQHAQKLNVSPDDIKHWYQYRRLKDEQSRAKKKTTKRQSQYEHVGKKKCLKEDVNERKDGEEDKKQDVESDLPTDATSHTELLNIGINMSEIKETENNLNSDKTVMLMQLDDKNDPAQHFKTIAENFDNGSKLNYGSLSIVPVQEVEAAANNINNDPAAQETSFTSSSSGLQLNYRTISVIPLSAMEMPESNVINKSIRHLKIDHTDSRDKFNLGSLCVIPPSVCVKPVDEDHTIHKTQDESKSVHETDVNGDEVSCDTNPDITANTKPRYQRKRRSNSKRTIFSDEDRAILEAAFKKNRQLDFETQEVLASQLNVRMKVIENWFTNKRRRTQTATSTSVKDDSDLSTPLNLMDISVPMREDNEKLPGSFSYLTNGGIIIKPEVPLMGFNIKETDSISSINNGKIFIRPEEPQRTITDTKETDLLSSVVTRNRRTSRHVTPMDISGTITNIADKKVTDPLSSKNQKIRVRSDILKNALTGNEKDPPPSPGQRNRLSRPNTALDTPVAKQKERSNETVIGDFKHLFVCDTCQKRFITKQSYNTHSCTTDKSHKCTYCDASFKSVQRLKTHTFIHTNEKPFSCGICDSKFRRSDRCQSHRISVHAGQERYQCDVCDEKFFTKTYLVNHLALHF